MIKVQGYTVRLKNTPPPKNIEKKKNEDFLMEVVWIWRPSYYFGVEMRCGLQYMHLLRTEQNSLVYCSVVCIFHGQYGKTLPILWDRSLTH